MSSISMHLLSMQLHACNCYACTRTCMQLLCMHVLSMQSISMGLLACNVEIQHGDEMHTSCTTPIAAWFSLQAGRMYHGRFQSGCGSVSQRLEAEVVSTW